MADPRFTDGPPRTLVLCFDGTSNEYDNTNSNVVKFFGLLNKDPSQQLCYYDPGVGTWFRPGVVSPLFNWCAKIMDLAVAWYLDQHVMDGYRFIMQNYREGDKICLFGFSRGAYTARALGGFLHKIGLLSRDNDSQVPFAWKLYKREDAESIELCEGFKATFCQKVKVEFMGVWDTVSSVGLIAGRTLPFTNSNSSVTTFRHALALDERRARFKPNAYHRPSPTLMAAAMNPDGIPNTTGGESSSSDSSTSSSSISSSASSSRKRKFDVLRSRISADKKERATEKAKQKAKAVEAVEEEKGEGRTPPIHTMGLPVISPPPTSPLPDDVLEVWFIGTHSDVGGGNTLNQDRNSLSHVPLRWMVREVLKSSCGIRFSQEALLALALDSMAQLDTVDALERIHDDLTGTFKERLWWILEILPMTHTWQDSKGVWHKSFGWNWGRGRDVHTPNPKFHRTVQLRMASNLGYTPRAKWEKGTEEYVA
ncbi:hypothetical protein BKA70DRAFT_1267909 [Coprinopsis sp. MPI-PUGE-AT-0042]|nr:hypothetical protein BKA70DRAFT_1267909 [Coprinopsis sp. MPI-PUGE-AT-0042]